MRKIFILICLLVGFCSFHLPLTHAVDEKTDSRNVIMVEFKLVCDNDIGMCEKAVTADTKEDLYVQKNPVITLNEISYAKAIEPEPVPEHIKNNFEKMGIKNAESLPEITLNLNATGKEKFAEITSRNVGKRMAIFIDGKLFVAPVIREPILGGSLAIICDSLEEAKSIVERINKAGNEPNKEN